MSDPLATAYSDYLRLRACSPHTIRRVECTLRLLGRILAPAGLAQADGEDIAQLLAAAKAPATRAARHSDVRAFYRWALRRGLVTADPTILIDGIRVPKNLPHPIDQWERVTHATDPDTALMVALGLYAGLRRSEIARLSTDDVHGTYLVVRGGKGGKDRQVPLHPAIRSMLVGRSGRLFHLTPESISRRIKQHLAACAVKATAHQLRHTFGTELARTSNGDLLMIGALMGHSNINTTQGYTQLGGDRGAAAVAAMFADDAA